MLNKRFLPYVITAALLLPLLSHLYLGQFNRAMGDDFCFTARAQNLGIAGTLDWWYNNWTGTYSSTFFQSLTGLAGLWRFVPSVLITLWLGAAVWMAYQFASLVNLHRRGLTSLLLGALIVYAANDGTANVFQSLYWTSGGITYTAPMVVLTFNIGVFLLAMRQQSPTFPYLALIAGLCMLAGGFSPLFAAFQASLCTLSMILSSFLAPKNFKRTALILSATAFIFAVIAFLILLIAPGNIIRRAVFDDPLPLLEMVVLTLTSSVSFLPLAFGFLSPASLLTTLVMTAFVGLTFQPLVERQYIYHHRWRWIGVVAVLGFILITACFFAGIVAISDLPPARAYIVPQFALVMMVAGLGYIAGMSLQRDYADKSQPLAAGLGRGLILIILAIGPVNAARETVALTSEFRVFASEWDARDVALRQAAAEQQSPITVDPLTVDLADYARVDPNNEQCFSDYYGLEGLAIDFKSP